MNRGMAETIIICLVIGVAAGFLSGLIGIGGGIIIIPALVMILGYSQKMAQGTTLALMLPPITIFAVINYYKQGFIDIKISLIVIIGFVIGSFFSSKLAMILPELILKRIFGVIMILVAIKMIFFK